MMQVESSNISEICSLIFSLFCQLAILKASIITKIEHQDSQNIWKFLLGKAKFEKKCKLSIRKVKFAKNCKLSIRKVKFAKKMQIIYSQGQICKILQNNVKFVKFVNDRSSSFRSSSSYFSNLGYFPNHFSEIA